MPIAYYDPSVRWAHHTVRLHYTQWDHHLQVDVPVYGNCQGFTILDAAIGSHFDRLCEAGDPASLTLTDAKGCELICEDEEDRGEEWLKGLCVGVEIVAQEEYDPEKDKP